MMGRVLQWSFHLNFAEWAFPQRKGEMGRLWCLQLGIQGAHRGFCMALSSLGHKVLSARLPSQFLHHSSQDIGADASSR